MFPRAGGREIPRAPARHFPDFTPSILPPSSPYIVPTHGVKVNKNFFKKSEAAPMSALQQSEVRMKDLQRQLSSSGLRAEPQLGAAAEAALPKPTSSALPTAAAPTAEASDASNPFGARLKPRRPHAGVPRRQLTGLGAAAAADSSGEPRVMQFF